MIGNNQLWRIASLGTHTIPSYDEARHQSYDLALRDNDTKFAAGDSILCRDTTLVWLPATVVSKVVVDGHSLYNIHYDGWASKYDELIPCNSYRLRCKTQLTNEQYVADMFS